MRKDGKSEERGGQVNETQIKERKKKRKRRYRQNRSCFNVKRQSFKQALRETQNVCVSVCVLLFFFFLQFTHCYPFVELKKALLSR